MGVSEEEEEGEHQQGDSGRAKGRQQADHDASAGAVAALAGARRALWDANGAIAGGVEGQLNGLLVSHLCELVVSQLRTDIVEEEAVVRQLLARS